MWCWIRGVEEEVSWAWPGFGGRVGRARKPGVERPGACVPPKKEQGIQRHGKIRAGGVSHGPAVGLEQDGTPLVTRATVMSASHGRTARRVSRPSNANVPQTISTPPENGPKHSGLDWPILSNRPPVRLGGEEELLDAFGQKHRADHPANRMAAAGARVWPSGFRRRAWRRGTAGGGREGRRVHDVRWRSRVTTSR